MRVTELSLPHEDGYSAVATHATRLASWEFSSPKILLTSRNGYFTNGWDAGRRLLSWPSLEGEKEGQALRACPMEIIWLPRDLSTLFCFEFRPPGPLCRRNALASRCRQGSFSTSACARITAQTTQRRNCSIQLRTFLFQLLQHRT